MFKHIKRLNLVVACLLVCGLGVACSTLTNEDTLSESEENFADPALDTAMVASMGTASLPPESAPLGGSPQDNLVQEKNRILVERYLENAKAFKESLKYEDAEQQLIEALNLDPSNADILKALNEVQSLLGKKTGEVGEIKRLASERYEVRKQQLMHKALDTFLCIFQSPFKCGDAHTKDTGPRVSVGLAKSHAHIRSSLIPFSQHVGHGYTTIFKNQLCIAGQPLADLIIDMTDPEAGEIVDTGEVPWDNKAGQSSVYGNLLIAPGKKKVKVRNTAV